MFLVDWYIEIARGNVSLLPEQLLERLARWKHVQPWMVAHRCRDCGKVRVQMQESDFTAEQLQDAALAGALHTIRYLYQCRNESCSDRKMWFIM